MVEKRDKSQALRDNLRRRKEQARNKAAGPETPPEHNEKPDKSRGSG
jgi:hypothetical protein